MGEARRLLKNTGIIAVGGMATKLAQFLLLPLYTSVLTTGEYGTVDYINTIALFCVPAVSLLMDEALFRFLIDCRTDAERCRAVTCSCAVAACGAVLFCLAALTVWLVWRPANLLWVAAIVLAGVLLQMTSALLRGFGETASYTVMNFLASLSTIVLNVIFIAVLHWGVAGMLSATAVSQGAVAVAFLVGKRAWRYLDPSALDRDYARGLVRYSLPLIPNKVSWTVMNMVDRLIIMNSLGAGPAGVYAVAYRFPGAMDTVYGFFYMSWKESSARALGAEGDESAFYDAVHRALSRFMMAVVLVMTALMPTVYALLIEDSYREGLLYVPILLLATYYSNMSGFYGGVFTAHRDTKIMGTTTVVSALLCLVLCLVLIPHLGLYGASLATLAATFTVNEYRRAKVARYARLGRDLRGRAAALAGLTATFALYYSYAFTGDTVLLVLCAAAALAYSIPANMPVVKKALSALRGARKGK